MCGIFCCAKLGFCNLNKSELELFKLTTELLEHRGPDSYNSISIRNLYFEGHVLWQQGDQLCSQPVNYDNENIILLFNGDIFMNREENDESDTLWLYKKICKCQTDDELIELFKTIKGPFSVIFYSKITMKLWFARDSLGRNSLLIGRLNEFLYFSSVIKIKESEQYSCIELPPLGLYSFDFSNKNNPVFMLYPYISPHTSSNHYDQIKEIEKIIKSELVIKKEINPDWLFTNNNNISNYNFKNIMNEMESNTDNMESLFTTLLSNEAVRQTVDQLISLLETSIKERIINTPNYCRKCILQKIDCTHAKVGILFSGGLDCSILAVLADKYIDKDVPIDLINVAFEECIRKQNIKKEISWNWDVPDRKTGQSTLKELNEILPNRLWNFIEVNVTRNELEQFLNKRISNLINPLETILDESLGAALWFAARGKGFLNNNEYNSSCRVILLGSGADEIFAGYSRHRKVFQQNNGCEKSLFNELELDWQRLPSRNLGRDDRVISDHGITPRTPYLQEDFIKFIRNLQPFQKCNLNLPQGIGDKLLLRICAYYLNLKKCAFNKKRALQFGSRIADNKQNGNDLSIYLINKI